MTQRLLGLEQLSNPDNICTASRIIADACALCTRADPRLINSLLGYRLVEQFGSTRRRRQLTAKENAVVRPDAVGGADALQEMLKSAADKAAESKMTKDDIMKQAQALRAIPPHHPEATKPHDAYRSVACHLSCITFISH